MGLALVLVGIGATAALPGELAVRLLGGQPLPIQQAPDLHRTVARLSEGAGIPPPRIYLLPDPAPNAMSIAAGAATRRHAALAVTIGLLRLLDRDECEGVIAHEIAHLRSHDTTLQRVAGSLLRTLLVLLRISLWFALAGLVAGAVPWTTALWALVLATGLPVLAVAAHQALSRTREFAADEAAAALTRNPLALASALHKLDRAERRLVSLLLGTGRQPPWLRSHPAARERIRRLERTAAPPPPPRTAEPWLLLDGHGRARPGRWR